MIAAGAADIADTAFADIVGTVDTAVVVDRVVGIAADTVAAVADCFAVDTDY